MSSAIPWRVVRRLAIELLPLAAALYVVAISLNHTTSVISDPHHVAAMIPGVILGYVLARSRFQGWTSVLYSSAVSIFAALQFATGFLPARLLGASDGEIGPIWHMNLRVSYFFHQVQNWWLSYEFGAPIRDQTILVFVLVVLLWNLATWLSWWTIREQNAFIGAFPLGAYLALVVSRSQLSLGYMQGFLLCVLIIAMSTHILSRHKSWDQRELDYPEGLELEWGISAVVIATIAVLGARVMPLVATPEGWEDIREWFQHDEQEARVLRKPNMGDIESGVATRPSTPELGVIGDPPASGNELVMWVKISDLAPPPGGILDAVNIPQHYWRSHIYTTYTGIGWEPYENVPRKVVVGPGEASHGRYKLDQTYALDTTGTEALYAVNDPYEMQDVSGEHLLDVDVILPPPEQGPFVYSISSWAASPRLNDLQNAPSIYPSDIAETYLQLPDNLPGRVINLSLRLTHEHTNAYDKAKRIESYLRANYVFDLNIPPPPALSDVVDYFLFDGKAGFCSYYASAMTVMLRSVGVPARVVSGYAMGSYNLEQDAYRVVEGDAHAWVEVYFPEFGWVEFEPTSNRSQFSRLEPTETVDPTQGSSELTELPARQITSLFIGGLVLVGSVLVIILRRRRRVLQSTVHFGIAGEIYAEMRALLCDAGFVGRCSETPYEFFDAVERKLEDQALIRGSFKQVTDIYMGVRFGGIETITGENRDMQSMWRKDRPAWIIFMVRQKWRNLWNRLTQGLEVLGQRLRIHKG